MSLVRVIAPAGISLNLGFAADPSFNVTLINAPSTWTCSLGTRTCSRPNNGASVLEFIQFVGTISTSAPATVTNTATVTGVNVNASGSDTAAAYRPSKVVRWGATTQRRANDVPTDFGYTSISSGFAHAVGLRPDGTPVMWGDTLLDQRVNLPSTTQFQAVASGSTHSIGLTLDGRIIGWGRNSVGQYNGGPSDAGYIAIACLDASNIALNNRGELVIWGYFKTNTTRDFPANTPQFSGIAGGYDHGVAIRPNGTIVQWGDNSLNQRFNISGGGGWKGLASSSYAPITQRQDNTLFQWGSDQNFAKIGLPTNAVAYYTSNQAGYGSGAQYADGSILIWGDSAFNIYSGAPTGGGFALNTLQLGAGGMVLLPLAQPTITTGNNQTTLVNSAFGNGLSLTVLDNRGGPVAGLPITFTAPGSGASGTFSNSSNTITVNTDSSGVANAGTFTANGSAGQYQVTASHPGLDPTVFALTNSRPLAVTGIFDGNNNPIGAMYPAGSGILNVQFNQPVNNANDVANYKMVGRNIDGQDPQSTSCAVLAPGDFNVGISGALYQSASNYVVVGFPMPASTRFKLLVCATNQSNSSNSLGNDAFERLGADVAAQVFASGPLLAVTGFTGNQASMTATLNAPPLASDVNSATVKLVATAAPADCSSGPAISGTVSLNGSQVTFTPNAPLGGGVYKFVLCGTIRGGNGGFLGSSTIGSAGLDYVASSTFTTPVTINVPAGLMFSFAGQTYTGSQTVNLEPGAYTLSTTSPQATGPGVRAAFASWSDGGAISHTVNVGSQSAIITANFNTEYQLTTAASAGGTVGPASGGFYAANTTVPVTATPNSGYFFLSWSGPVVNNTVTMTGPVSIVANFLQNAAITWANPANITFGTPLGSTQLNATANMPGTFVYTPAAGTFLSVGSAQPLSVRFTPTDTRVPAVNAAVVINVVAPANGGLAITRSLSRDAGTNEVLVQLTYLNLGSAGLTNLRLNTATIGSTSATAPAMPAVVTASLSGYTVTTQTLRFPASIGVRGAAVVLNIAGVYTQGTFSSSARVTLP